MIQLGYLNIKTKIGLEKNNKKSSEITNEINKFETKSDLITMQSKMDQILILIRSLYPNEGSHNSFTSKDIFELYKTKINQNISQSTVSTYLYRLFENKILTRTGTKKDYIYRLRKEKISEIPYYSILNERFITSKKI